MARSLIFEASAPAIHPFSSMSSRSSVPTVAVLDAPARAFLDDLAKLVARKFQETVAADARRHALEKQIDHFFQSAAARPRA